MRKWLIGTAIAVLTISCAAVAPSAAQQKCEPVAEITQGLSEAGIHASRVLVSFDVGFVNDYHKVVNVNIPDGVEPIGMLAVDRGDIAIIGIIENPKEPCVRLNMVLPSTRHKAAVSIANRGV